ncbi:MAG: transposase [Bacilli bacterium]|nr:transposase [Bacilli bacterium]
MLIHPGGEKIYGETSGRKYKRTSIVAAWTGHKIIAPLEYSGTMDSILFEYWFEGMLLPGLQQGSTIVMDNAAFHHKTQLLSIAEEQGYRLIFLPPYSPELNPIEKFWSWLKRHLKKILPFFSSFDDTLFECFQVI